MTQSELLYLTIEPFFTPLYVKVRRHLLKIARAAGANSLMLDVGCRTSPYTTGVPARFVLSDLPRTTALQEEMYLGLSKEMVSRLYRRRSNISSVVFDDMTQSSLATGRFDCVVSVEVLEHVEKDSLFVNEVHRVLKSGGVFVMTTPNGDYLENVNNPDHWRHYRRQQLHDLLASRFKSVKVEYAIRTGRFYRWGHDSWSLKHPIRTLRIMMGNSISLMQSRGDGIRERAEGTEHLIAVARK